MSGIKYTVFKNGDTILYIQKGNMIIPAVDGNSQYAEYLFWLSEGNTPETVEV